MRKETSREDDKEAHDRGTQRYLGLWGRPRVEVTEGKRGIESLDAISGRGDIERGP